MNTPSNITKGSPAAVSSGFGRTTRALIIGAAMFASANAATILTNDSYVVNVGPQKAANFDDTAKLIWNSTTTVVLSIPTSVATGISAADLDIYLNVRKTAASGGGLVNFSSGFTFTLIGAFTETTVTGNDVVRSGNTLTDYSQLGSWLATTEPAPADGTWDLEITYIGPGQIQAFSGDPTNGLVPVDGSLPNGGIGDAASVTAVPEPTAAVLGAFGLLALLRRRR